MTSHRFETKQQALDVLKNPSEASWNQEMAIQYLAYLDDPQTYPDLIEALLDNDFGVRWEAAVALASKGRRALPALLNTLIDPKQVEHVRIREGAYHILHYNSDPYVRLKAANLMQAIKGPAADLTAMKEAFRLMEEFKPQNQTIA